MLNKFVLISVISLGMILIFGSTYVEAAMPVEKIFVADIFSIPAEIDPAAVKSASEFIILTHLARPLIKLNKNAQLEGDLLDSWDVTSNFTKFSFKIKAGSKWSNGTDITANQVVESLMRQVKINMGNHFNFSNIKEIKVIDSSHFSINLNTSNVNFIKMLSYPEFGILSSEDAQAKLNKIKFQVTSGPYYLEKKSLNGYELRRNEFYPNFSSSAPSYVRFQSTSDANKQVAELTAGHIDFAIPSRELTDVIHKKASSDPKIEIAHPHIGYSFWVSINPNSENLQNKSTRNWLQILLRNHAVDLQGASPNWSVASQLYLPDGPGRPSEERLDRTWEKIKNDAKEPSSKIELSFLVDATFIFKEQLIKALSNEKIKLSVVTHKTADEYFKLIKEKHFDLIETRNDYSSDNLAGSLATTFNPLHPLIFTDKADNQFQDRLKNADAATSEEAKHKIHESIAIDVLEKGYVAPELYNKILFYYRKGLDISEWSTLFPEISLWKINAK